MLPITKDLSTPGLPNGLGLLWLSSMPLRTFILLWSSLSMLAAYGLTGCSRAQKSGNSITAQDVAQAMPEFMLVMPPGASNVFLERISHSPATIAYLKITVPRSSLTNFLTLSGLNGEFMPVPGGVFARGPIPLPGAINMQGAINWVSDVRHSKQWDPGKGHVPLRMGVVQTTARSSPNGQVFLMILVDDSTNPQANVFLQYCRGPKRR